MLNNNFQRTKKHELLACLATGAFTVFYIWTMFTLDKKSQKDDAILQQKLESVQKELENKNLDIYAKVRLHEEERLLIYFDYRSRDYRKLKRQILKEYRQKNK